MGLFSKKMKASGDMPVLFFDIEKITGGAGGNFARQLNIALLKEILLENWCPGAGTMFLTGENEIQGVRSWCIALEGYAGGQQVETNMQKLTERIGRSSMAHAFIGYYMANSDDNYGLVWDFDIQRDIAPWNGIVPCWSYHAIDREGHGNEGHDYGLGYKSFHDVFRADTVRQ